MKTVLLSAAASLLFAGAAFAQDSDQSQTAPTQQPAAEQPATPSTPDQAAPAPQPANQSGQQTDDASKDKPADQPAEPAPASPNA